MYDAVFWLIAFGVYSRKDTCLEQSDDVELGVVFFWVSVWLVAPYHAVQQRADCKLLIFGPYRPHCPLRISGSVYCGRDVPAAHAHHQCATDLTTPLRPT